MTYNIKKIIATLLVGASFLPVVVFAENTQGGTDSTETQKTKQTENFCSRLSTVQAKFALQITTAETKQSVYQTNRANTIAQKEAQVDAKRADDRTKTDAKRAENLEKMQNRAKTDSMKAAVASYKTALTDAVTARRSSIDEAVKTYRDGLTGIMASHKTTIEQALSTFKGQVADAVTKAKTDCTSGLASKTVKENFTQAITLARKTLAQARTDANMNTSLLALKKTRDDALARAQTTFKTAVEKAHADLVIALKK